MPVTNVRTRALSRTTAVAAAVIMGTAGTGVQPVRAADGGGTSALRSVLVRSVRENNWPGALAQTRKHGHVHNIAVGVADRRTGQRPRPAMRFRAGSITKTFVATTILQLVAEHRLRLSDRIDRWLPGLISGNGNNGRLITIRMLLNHTSGLFDYVDDEDLARAYEENPSLYLPPRALVRVAVSHPPLFRPGTSWAYSDTDYVVLGMLIRRITGRSYAEEITRRIIRPLHLRGTYFPGRSQRIRPPYMHGYRLTDSGAIEDATKLNITFAPASGDLISRVGDLNRFDSRLLAGRLLPRRLLRQMLRPVPGSQPYPGSNLHRYGLGIIISRLPCHVTVYGHGGTVDGFLTSMAVTRHGGHALTWVVNGSWGNQVALTDQSFIAEFCHRTR